MRSLICAVIIGVIIVTIGVFYNINIANISEHMLTLNKEAGQMIDEENYDAAEKKINEMSEFLDSKNVILSAMDNHEEISNIKQNISEFREFTKHRIKSDASAKSRALTVLLGHMPENYRILPENIL